MGFKSILLITLIVGVSVTFGQRPSYAGPRPGGYKDRFTSVPITTTVASAVATGNSSDIGNRLGEAGPTVAGPTTTTQRLPYDAHGDTFLVNQLSQLPKDKQPYWLVNQAAIEAHRGGTQQAATAAAAAAQSNGQSLSDRFGGSDSVNPNINSYNVISKQEIVYPVNIPVQQQQQQEQLVPTQTQQAQLIQPNQPIRQQSQFEASPKLDFLVDDLFV